MEARFPLARDLGELGQETREFILVSGTMLHVFGRPRTDPAHLVCFVCRRGANVGLVLAKSRAAIETVAAELQAAGDGE